MTKAESLLLSVCKRNAHLEYPTPTVVNMALRYLTLAGYAGINEYGIWLWYAPMGHIVEDYDQGASRRSIVRLCARVISDLDWLQAQMAIKASRAWKHTNEDKFDNKRYVGSTHRSRYRDGRVQGTGRRLPSYARRYQVTHTGRLVCHIEWQPNALQITGSTALTR